MMHLLVQLWKRSGAWFYKGLPQYIRPAPKKPVENSSMRISTLSSKSGVLRSSSSQSARKTYGSWSRTSATRLLLYHSFVYCCSKLKFCNLKIAIHLPCEHLYPNMFAKFCLAADNKAKAKLNLVLQP